MSIGDHRLALPAGYELGKYRFQEILGSGGFGITYLAEDRMLSRKVAIKELLPNDIATRVDGTTVAAKTKSEEENLTWARERFVNEGRALAACDHANVVHVYEMVEANGTAYMVTKYEEGRSLEPRWLVGPGACAGRRTGTARGFSIAAALGAGEGACGGVSPSRHQAGQYLPHFGRAARAARFRQRAPGGHEPQHGDDEHRDFRLRSV